MRVLELRAGGVICMIEIKVHKTQGMLWERACSKINEGEGLVRKYCLILSMWDALYYMGMSNNCKNLTDSLYALLVMFSL